LMNSSLVLDDVDLDRGAKQSVNYNIVVGMRQVQLENAVSTEIDVKHFTGPISPSPRHIKR
jgi:hypothetical protein